MLPVNLEKQTVDRTHTGVVTGCKASNYWHVGIQMMLKLSVLLSENAKPKYIKTVQFKTLHSLLTISKAVHAYIPAVRTVRTSPGTVSTVKQAGFTSPAIGSIKPHRSRAFTIGCVVYGVANKLVSKECATCHPGNCKETSMALCAMRRPC